MNKLVQYLQTWRFVIHLNVGFIAINIIQAFFGFHIAYLAGIAFHSGMAMMCHFLSRYETRHQSDQIRMMIMHDRWVHAHNRVVIYQKHFGNLTPGMEQELHEEEKKAIEESENKEIRKED